MQSSGKVLNFGVSNHTPAQIELITLQGWSPFQKGFFDGIFLGDREKYSALNDVIDELAAKYDVAPAAIAVAWITRHPANIQVVLGTTNISHLADAADGAVGLTSPEWYRLFTAAGHVLPLVRRSFRGVG